MRRSLFAVASLLLASVPALAGGTAVPLDQARVIVFKKPVATLYVGNPLVADVTMIDKRRAMVQGKGYGTTNIIAMDAHGRQIANDIVVVAGGGPALVTLQRGVQRTTYACASSRCEVTPMPGDSQESFGTSTNQMTQHQSMLSKAATDDVR